MQEKLATRILARVMGWQEEQVRAEIGPLLVLAEAKYDRYQQYSPGMRFLESFAVWLEGFTPSQRQHAFELVRDRLVYISSDEMFHLIQTAFADHLRPLLHRIAADRQGVPYFKVASIDSSVEFRSLLAKTLYVGLSDGSQIGLLRRLNPGLIGHEHTLISYDRPQPPKAKEMLEEHLPDAIEAMTGTRPESDVRFEVLVLVDDFSASGISFFRTEGGEPKGKLSKILREVKESRYAGLLTDGPLHICVLFYVATPAALDKLRTDAQMFLDEHLANVTLHVLAVQELKEEVMIVPEEGDSVDDFLKAAVAGSEDKLMDKHWRKGKHDRPHLGYNECALPVVLFHNTPNNSLPALWFAGQEKSALFPRTTRHGHQ